MKVAQHADEGFLNDVLSDIGAPAHAEDVAVDRALVRADEIARGLFFAGDGSLNQCAFFVSVHGVLPACLCGVCATVLLYHGRGVRLHPNPVDSLGNRAGELRF